MSKSSFVLASSRRNRPFSASTSVTDRFTGTAAPSAAVSLPARLSLIQFHRLESGMPNRLAALLPPIDSLSLTASTLNSSVYCRFGTDSLLPIAPLRPSKSYQQSDARETRAESGHQTVYVGEGEKCVEELWTRGIPATTNAGGAGKWKTGPFHEGHPYAEQLTMVGVQKVVILLDNNDPERRHAEDVARACRGVGLGAKVVELPGLPPKGDVVDYLKDHAKEDLFKAVKSAPSWAEQEPPATNQSALGEGQLLEAISSFLRRYVVLSPEQLVVVAAWVVHTHVFGAAESTPYLSITSATKQAGKTRLLEVLELLVATPWFTGRATAAVLVRRINDESPTLLLDESDAAFKVESEYTEALRSILNSGYRRTGRASLCLAGGASYLDLSTFCPRPSPGSAVSRTPSPTGRSPFD